MYREYSDKGHDHSAIMNSIYAKGRDNARTPMQWNDENNAGFTTGAPWLAVNPNYKEINVELALADKGSIFYYYKKLIELRKRHDVIVYGDYALVDAENEQIYAFTRTLGNEQLLVILNFYEHPAQFVLDREEVSFDANTAELLISNYDVPVNQDIDQLTLRPYEARVYKLAVN
ncbi:Oligo-1,6-glucosidase [compost metagenome]